MGVCVSIFAGAGGEGGVSDFDGISGDGDCLESGK